MKKIAYAAMIASSLCALSALWLAAPDTPLAAPKLATILPRAPATPGDSTQAPSPAFSTPKNEHGEPPATPSACDKSNLAISQLAVPYLSSSPPWLHPSADKPLREALDSINPAQPWTFKIALYDDASPHKARISLATREEWTRLAREHSKEIAFHTALSNANELEGLIEARDPGCGAPSEMSALRTVLLAFIDLSSTHASASTAVYYQATPPAAPGAIGSAAIVVDSSASSRKAMLDDLAMMRERASRLGQSAPNSPSEEEPNAGEPTSVPQQP